MAAATFFCEYIIVLSLPFLAYLWYRGSKFDGGALLQHIAIDDHSVSNHSAHLVFMPDKLIPIKP
ncbi:putative membrane protein [Propionispora sp. 2/2-37]|nr:putative membrane protein [Propionispora sp. 2/2-37]